MIYWYQYHGTMCKNKGNAMAIILSLKHNDMKFTKNCSFTSIQHKLCEKQSYCRGNNTGFGGEYFIYTYIFMKNKIQ